MRNAITVALMICVISFQVQAQTKIRKAFEPMTDEKLNSIPDFKLKDIYKDRIKHPLPEKVENSQLKYFPPFAWGIQGWSCANATAVAYCYNYEVLCLLDSASTGIRPQFPYEYTYHFLNGGDQAKGGDGWMFVEAFDICKETGVPSSNDFGGFEWGNSFGGWMSGYQKYYTAMKNRSSEYYKIDASVESADELIKQYLYDHGDESPHGGLLTFQVSSSNWTIEIVDGRMCITKFGPGGGHALTIVGYDDTYNGGCYHACGNWGEGFYWAPYRLFRAGAGLATKQGTPIMLCRIKNNYKPQVTFKIKMAHDQRDQIAIMTGVANGDTATFPTSVKDYQGAFNYAGGNYPMCGKDQNPSIDIGLDLTDFAKDVTGAKAVFFLLIKSKGGGAGQVDSLTLMDYTGNSVKEFPCAETNKPITETTLMSIPWQGNISSADNSSKPDVQHQQKVIAVPGCIQDNVNRVRFYYNGNTAQKIVLRIFDISGRLAYVTEAPAIKNSIFWGLVDLKGRRVAEGIYIAKLEIISDDGRIEHASVKVTIISN